MTRAFITGTSSGIGKAITELLLNTNQYKITGISRRNNILHHPNYSHKSIDLSLVENTLNFKFEDLENYDSYLLINNSGMVEPVAHLGNSYNEKIQLNYSLNLITPSILSNKFLKALKSTNKKVHIINVSSGAGKYPIDGWSIYNASKAGIDMFSRVLKDEIEIQGKSNIYIHSIAPGIVDTEMQGVIRQSDKSNFSNIDKFKDYYKNGDLANPQTVAEKYLKVIQAPEKFKEVVISVRDF